MSKILINIKGVGDRNFVSGVTLLEILSETKGISSDSIICKVDGILTDYLLLYLLIVNCNLWMPRAKMATVCFCTALLI